MLNKRQFSSSEVRNEYFYNLDLSVIAILYIHIHFLFYKVLYVGFRQISQINAFWHRFVTEEKDIHLRGIVAILNFGTLNMLSASWFLQRAIKVIWTHLRFVLHLELNVSWPSSAVVPGSISMTEFPPNTILQSYLQMSVLFVTGTLSQPGHGHVKMEL